MFMLISAHHNPRHHLRRGPLKKVGRLGPYGGLCELFEHVWQLRGDANLLRRVDRTCRRGIHYEFYTHAHK